MIPISKIIFSKEEEKAVLKVLRSGQWAQGIEVERFEQEFAKYLNVKYAIAVSNGTVALYLALISLGLKRGLEVITTPFSFMASTSAILHAGLKPVFIDIGHDFNVDVEKIEEKITPKTRAILPVHLFGNPCEMDAILSLAGKYKLSVIEDACQAHGAECHGKKAGTFGRLGCFSFYATKNITTGEGGMIVTNDKNLYEFLKKARNHGSKKRYFHDFLGFNFRMTEMQAALGRIKLKKLDNLNKKRLKNALFLNSLLKDIPGLTLPEIPTDKKHVFHQYTVVINKEFPLTREELVTILEKKGIGYGIFYPLPIHKQVAIKKMIKNVKLPVSEDLSKRVVSLPIHPYLNKKELNYIAYVIKNST